MKIPDHLPDDLNVPSTDAITAKCAEAVEAVIDKYRQALGLAACIGVLETVKHDMIRLAIEKSLTEDE